MRTKLSTKSPQISPQTDKLFYRTQVSWGPIYVSVCLSVSKGRSPVTKCLFFFNFNKVYKWPLAPPPPPFL